MEETRSRSRVASRDRAIDSFFFFRRLAHFSFPFFFVGDGPGREGFAANAGARHDGGLFPAPPPPLPSLPLRSSFPLLFRCSVFLPSRLSFPPRSSLSLAVCTHEREGERED